MDDLDRRLIGLLRVNARLPLVRLAQSLGVARSTAQLRLRALEERGIITGYTLSLGDEHEKTDGIRAIVMIALDTAREAEIVAQLSRRHEITKLYTISGRYDLAAMLDTDSTGELDTLLNRIRQIGGVTDTFSTIVLRARLDRPG